MLSPVKNSKIYYYIDDDNNVVCCTDLVTVKRRPNFEAQKLMALRKHNKNYYKTKREALNVLAKSAD